MATTIPSSMNKRVPPTTKAAALATRSSINTVQRCFGLPSSSAVRLARSSCQYLQTPCKYRGKQCSFACGRRVRTIYFLRINQRRHPVSLEARSIGQGSLKKAIHSPWRPVGVCNDYHSARIVISRPTSEQDWFLAKSHQIKTYLVSSLVYPGKVDCTHSRPTSEAALLASICTRGLQVLAAWSSKPHSWWGRQSETALYCVDARSSCQCSSFGCGRYPLIHPWWYGTNQGISRPM